MIFRHLKNVSHIGHLVITTEEAIAKGIRRIVAVTGPEAEHALRRAELIDQRLKKLSSVVDETEKNASDTKTIKKLSKEVADFVEV